LAVYIDLYGFMGIAQFGPPSLRFPDPL
jgi:hypothetical protein